MIELTDYNSVWDEKFLLLKNELLLSCKDLIVDIQHIGSTSIYGMKAKDIVDIQCSIRSFDEIKLIKTKLESIGFEMIEDIKQDHVPFKDKDYFSPEWEKRFFKGSFQNQAYNLHIRLVDSLNWKFALSFRDFLSENHKAKYAFMQVKERLAESGVDKYAYCILKDSIIDLMSLQFARG
ncbi:MAG: GrpB family protein [Legionellaceae bacterium]|nr:GrpB family protein [Legionellaceae bacterium]